MTQQKSKILAVTVMALGLVNVSNLDGQETSWKDETALVSPQGDQTVVRKMNSDKMLFQNKDAQLAIEWAMANATTTVVTPGHYVTNDSIDAPRDGVTLIIDQGASIKVDPDANHKTNLTFRSSSSRGKYSQQLVPVVYVFKRNNVRVYNFGDLQSSNWNHPDQELPKPELYKDRSLRFIKEEITGRNGQTFPIVFDGRNEKLTCGVQGGVIVNTGTAHNFVLGIDCEDLEVPLVCPVPSGVDAVLCFEGCHNAKVGWVVNIARVDEDGKRGHTGEVLDLNSSCTSTSVDFALGENTRMELIDSNASQLTIDEIVAINKSNGKEDYINKLLIESGGSGQRWTYRDRRHSPASIGKQTKLEDVLDVKRTIKLPKFPDALPRFDVTATVEITLENGSKKTYTKTVYIDITK
jgi:hypothetical protein